MQNEAPSPSRRLLLALAALVPAWATLRGSAARAGDRGGAIRGLDHVGLAVRDIAAATDFLRAGLGAEILYETLPPGSRPQAGPDAERRLGLVPGAAITAVRMLRLANGPGLELFQIEAPDQNGPARTSDLGWQHIAVYTDDMEAALARFAGAGGAVLSEPHPLPPLEAGSGNRFCYARMPFGPVVEFITYPSRQSYRDKTDLRRWTPPD